MKKSTLVIILIIIIPLIIYYIIPFIELSISINKGGTFEREVLNSPDNKEQITILLHTDGVMAWDYKSYIYIIPGQYTKEKSPDYRNYIKFPNATKVHCRWKTNDKFVIVANKKPINNDFKLAKIKLDLVVDEDKIDELQKQGKKIFLYSLKNK
jgi:hypothetical protein